MVTFRHPSKKARAKKESRLVGSVSVRNLRFDEMLGPNPLLEGEGIKAGIHTLDSRFRGNDDWVGRE